MKINVEEAIKILQDYKECDIRNHPDIDSRYEVDIIEKENALVILVTVKF